MPLKRLLLALLLALPLAGQTIAPNTLQALAPGCATLAKQNVPYSCRITPSKGIGPYSFTLASGGFPAGLSMSTGVNGGLISGTPTGTSAATAVVTVADSGVSSQQVTISITPASLTSIAITGASNVAVGSTAQLATTTVWSAGPSIDITPYGTWASSVTADATVGTGGTNNGLVTGVASGSSNITVSFNGKTSPTFAVGVSGGASNPIVTTASLPDCQITGSAYSQTLAASGGTGGYTNWTVSSGSLPSGLSLGSTTGQITGTCGSGATTQTFSVTVQDSSSHTSAGQSLTIAADALSSIAISCSPSPACQSANQTQQVQFNAVETYAGAGGTQNNNTGAAVPITDVCYLAASDFTGTSFASITTSAGGNVAGNAGACNQPAGATIIVVCRDAADATSCIPSDTAGDTFTIIGSLQSINSGAAHAAFYYAANVSANTANKVTCTPFTSQPNLSCQAHIESGTASSPLDASATANVPAGTASTITSNSVTTSNNNDVLVMGGATSGHGRTFTAVSPFGSVGTDPDGSAAMADELVSSTGSYSGSITIGGSVTHYGAFLAAFKSATTGAVWTTTDVSGTNVATVNNSGLVTANNAGTSNIKMCIGATCSPNILLTVSAGGITSLTISPTSAAISIGGTVTFQCLGQPGNQNVTGTSTFQTVVQTGDTAGAVTLQNNVATGAQNGTIHVTCSH